MKTTRIFSACLFLLLATESKGQTFAPITKTGFPAPERVRAVSDKVITCNYLSTLRSDCEAIQESALGHVAYIRICRPNADLGQLRRKIDSLTVSGSSPSVRYKAFLTELVFSSPELFNDVSFWKELSLEELFPAIEGRMRASVLSAGSVTPEN